MKDFLLENGYSKKGKIYTPPFLQFENFNTVHWIDEIIPEIFWIGVLQNKYGFADGSNLASNLARLALEVNDNKSNWYGLVSNFNHLNITEKTEIRDILTRTNNLALLQEAFQSIEYYYPEFPLNFIFANEKPKGNFADIENFKKYLDSIFDRTSIEANLLQGVALDLIFASDFDIKISPNLALAQFPKFPEYPNTEISKQVASAIRNAINDLYVSIFKVKIDQKWQKYFWSRGFQIDKCK